MTCNCKKETKEQDGKCPEGQDFDVSQQKCVPKKSEALDDSAASTQGKLPDGDPGEPQSMNSRDCKEGHVYDESLQKCVPVDADKTAVSKDMIAQTNTDISKETLDRLVSALDKRYAQKSTTEKKPTAQVANQDRKLTIHQIAEEYGEAIRDKGKYEFNIPLEVLRATRVGPAANDPKYGLPVAEVFRAPSQVLHLTESWSRPNKTIIEGYNQKTLKEAVALSGTHATQDLDTDVAIVPGGISFVPVFQFAKTKEVGAGSDRARFFKTSLPSNGSQTAGSTPSEATQTISSIEVTPSTITGVYLIGDFDEIENSPFDLLQTIVEASSASFEDFVATDMLTTVSAQGTLTAGAWYRADTGATITSSDIASVTFDETGIAVGREYLENQGYLRGGVKPVCFLHPKQWRQLITSTNVTSLATRSVPDIFLKAELEELFGVQLVVTNAVEAKNNTGTDAYNAIMCVPKHSYGIGIKRDVTVKMHEIPEDNQVRVNTTWRVKSGVIDASSIVRLSSSQ